MPLHIKRLLFRIYHLLNPQFWIEIILVCVMFLLIGVRFFAELTELIARKVGVKPGRIVLGKFANQETQVQLTDNVRGQDVYVIQVRLHPL
jgi:hypothetical protein